MADNVADPYSDIKEMSNEDLIKEYVIISAERRRAISEYEPKLKTTGEILDLLYKEMKARGIP
jgi:hypothetical protein